MSRLSSTFKATSHSSVHGGKLNNRYVIDISGAVGQPVQLLNDRADEPAEESHGNSSRYVFEHYYVRNLQEQVHYQEKQLADLRDEVHRKLQKHPAFVEEAQLMMSRMRTLEQEISELSDKLRTKKKQGESQQADTDSSVQKLLRSQSENGNEKTNLQSRLSEKKRVFTQKEAELKHFERLYIERKSELERLVTLTKSHEEQAARLKQQIRDATNECAAMEALIEQTEKSVQQAKKQTVELATRVVHAEGVANRTGVQKESLLTELDCFEQRVAKLISMHEQEVAHCSQLQGKQGELLRDKERLLSTIEDAKKRVEIKNDDPRVRSAALSRQREVLGIMRHIDELEREKRELELSVRVERARRNELLDGAKESLGNSDFLGVNQLALREKVLQEKDELSSVRMHVKSQRAEVKKLQDEKRRLQKAARKKDEELQSRDALVAQKRGELKRVEDVLCKLRAGQSTRWTEFEKIADSLKWTAASAVDHDCPASHRHATPPPSPPLPV